MGRDPEPCTGGSAAVKTLFAKRGHRELAAAALVGRVPVATVSGEGGGQPEPGLSGTPKARDMRPWTTIVLALLLAAIVLALAVQLMLST